MASPYCFGFRSGWLVASLTALSVATSPLPADENKDKATIESKIKSLLNEVGNLLSKKESAQSDLAKIEKKTGALADKIRRLEKELAHLKQERQSLDDQLEREMAQRRALQARLATQARTAYTLGRQEPVKLWFNQSQAEKLNRMLTYYQYFNQARIKQIEQAQMHLDAIEALESQLDQEKIRQQSVLEHLNQEKKQLQSLHRKREQLLAQINRQLKNRRTLLARLEEDKRNLEKMIESARQATDDLPPVTFDGKPFPKSKGRLIWPVQGKLGARFGSLRAGSNGWEGVVIHAPAGTPVRAIHPGRVIFADWLRGYGMLIIIKHDHNYMSLYGFNQSLMKNVGDTVTAGEVIANVGSSGGRRRPGLYFAIRHRHKPLDPQRWCRKSRNGRVG